MFPPYVQLPDKQPLTQPVSPGKLYIAGLRTYARMQFKFDGDSQAGLSMRSSRKPPSLNERHYMVIVITGA